MQIVSLGLLLIGVLVALAVIRKIEKREHPGDV
jgi:hypothetical protein